MIEPALLITILPVDNDTALLYTITCTYNNKYDWRFPTEDEWVTHSWIPSRCWTEPRMYSPLYSPDSIEFRYYELCIVRTI